MANYPREPLRSIPKKKREGGSMGLNMGSARQKGGEGRTINQFSRGQVGKKKLFPDVSWKSCSREKGRTYWELHDRRWKGENREEVKRGYVHCRTDTEEETMEVTLKGKSEELETR